MSKEGDRYRVKHDDGERKNEAELKWRGKREQTMGA